jgi:hypothetical protein
MPHVGSVSVHPLQESRTEPLAALAASVTCTPSSNDAAQVGGQEIPAGVLDTVAREEGTTRSVCFSGGTQGMPMACAIACP